MSLQTEAAGASQAPAVSLLFADRDGDWVTKKDALVLAILGWCPDIPVPIRWIANALYGGHEVEGGPKDVSEEEYAEAWAVFERLELGGQFHYSARSLKDYSLIYKSVTLPPFKSAWIDADAVPANAIRAKSIACGIVYTDRNGDPISKHEAIVNALRKVQKGLAGDKGDLLIPDRMQLNRVLHGCELNFGGPCHILEAEYLKAVEEFRREHSTRSGPSACSQSG